MRCFLGKGEKLQKSSKICENPRLGSVCLLRLGNEKCLRTFLHKLSEHAQGSGTHPTRRSPGGGPKKLIFVLFFLPDRFVLLSALWPFVRKSVVSVKYPPVILGPEMAAPILWARGIFWFFLLENPHAHKILPFIGDENWTQTIFFSNFSGYPGISQQNPGISRPKSLISLVSRDIPNFLATPSCGRPLPHRKISELKSLGLGSFFVPDSSAGGVGVS